MTLQQWREDANLRGQLDALLKEPALEIALGIVYAAGLKPAIAPPGVDLIHFSALAGARKEGYLEAIANLRKLTEITSRKPLKEKPWTIDPKTMPPEKFADDEQPKPETKTTEPQLETAPAAT